MRITFKEEGTITWVSPDGLATRPVFVQIGDHRDNVLVEQTRLYPDCWTVTNKAPELLDWDLVIEKSKVSVTATTAIDTVREFLPERPPTHETPFDDPDFRKPGD